MSGRERPGATAAVLVDHYADVRLLLVSAFPMALLTLLGATGGSLGTDRLLKFNTSKAYAGMFALRHGGRCGGCSRSGCSGSSRSGSSRSGVLRPLPAGADGRKGSLAQSRPA